MFFLMIGLLQSPQVKRICQILIHKSGCRCLVTTTSHIPTFEKDVDDTANLEPLQSLFTTIANNETIESLPALSPQQKELNWIICHCSSPPPICSTLLPAPVHEYALTPLSLIIPQLQKKKNDTMDTMGTADTTMDNLDTPEPVPISFNFL